MLGVGTGGRRCREEGGCHARDGQCVLYYVTAPYYHALLPFVITDKKIKQHIEKLTQINTKAKKNASKQAQAYVEQQALHKVYLDQTFPVLSSNVIEQLEACPAR